MRAQNISYMYECEWTDDFVHRSGLDYYSPEIPGLIELHNTVILPAKESDLQTWGIGGADVNKTLFEQIRQGIAFGGCYSYSTEDEVHMDETVYYIPVIMKHWGHFLIDVLSRFWFLLDGMDQGYRIAFCSLDFYNAELQGNYAEAVRLLNVPADRMLFVDRPMRFRKIIVPKASFGYSMKIHEVYLRTISFLKEKALCSVKTEELIPVEKIYFTRTRFQRAKLMEVGEKEIETLFASIGYRVMAPEALSFTEQVFYLSNCRELAGLSGSVMHNILFTEEDTKVAILNRTCMPNPPQFAINQASKAEITYIDCYSKWTLSHPQDYGGPNGGPVQVEVNENLYKYLYDCGYGCCLTDSRPQALKKLRNLIRFFYLKLRNKAKKTVFLTNAYRKCTSFYHRSSSISQNIQT